MNDALTQLMTNGHGRTSPTLDNMSLRTTLLGVVPWLMNATGCQVVASVDQFEGLPAKLHEGVTENERVDKFASQGRLSSPVWTANKLWLTLHKNREREGPRLDLHVVGLMERTPPSQPDDFVLWTPELVPSRASSSVIVCTPELPRPSDRAFINLDATSP